jgi:hypothetical protein
MIWFEKKKKESPKKPTRQELIAQAQANARKARAEIGEETIQKVAAQFQEEQEKILQKKKQITLDQARDTIRAMDKSQVADHLRSLIDDK